MVVVRRVFSLRRIPRAGQAFFTRQGLSEVPGASLCRDHPGAFLPRRPMAYMLGMAACQIRHPVIVFILMKADNCPLNARHAASRVEMGTIADGGVNQCR